MDYLKIKIQIEKGNTREALEMLHEFAEKILSLYEDLHPDENGKILFPLNIKSHDANVNEIKGHKKSILQLKTRFNGLKKKVNLGTISVAEATIESSKITQSVIDITEDLKDMEQNFLNRNNFQLYSTVTLKDENMWLAQNLNIDTVEGCWKNKQNKIDYGFLYTWEAAQNACPKGWHIPTDEEWWNLASLYGKASNTLVDREINTFEKAGQNAFHSLIKRYNSVFAAELGGFKNLGESIENINIGGYYWSNNSYDSLEALGYYFFRPKSNFNRFKFNKNLGFSCRLIQDR